MLLGRRLFFVQSGGLVAAAAGLGCRTEALDHAPVGLTRSVRRVAQTVKGLPTTDGAGVRLSRIIGQAALPNLDPFILLDRFHSDDPSAYIRGFPDHPHRGFETVTVMLSGGVRHRDSRGNHGLITGGGAQWMTAGRGIVHSEMPVAMGDPERVPQTPPVAMGDPRPPEGALRMFSGFQLWVNLPASEKMCAPVYQDLPPSAIHEDRLSPAGSRVRIISGAGGAVRERPTQPTLLTVALEDDRPFEIDTPKGHRAFVFVAGGSTLVGPEDAGGLVEDGKLAVLTEGDRLRVRATDSRSEVLVAFARPLREPIVQRGPFVMNTEEEIRRAWDDYRAGLLDKS